MFACHHNAFDIQYSKRYDREKHLIYIFGDQFMLKTSVICKNTEQRYKCWDIEYNNVNFIEN